MIDIRYLYFPPRSFVPFIVRLGFLFVAHVVVLQVFITNGLVILRDVYRTKNGKKFLDAWLSSKRTIQKKRDHVSSPFYDWQSEHNRMHRYYAAEAGALHINYLYDERKTGYEIDGVWDQFWSDFWLRWSSSSRAVRNRKDCIEQLLLDSFRRVYKKWREIRIVSLASGSARAVLDALKIFVDEEPDCKIAVLLIDIDRKSLRSSSIEFKRDYPQIDFQKLIGDIFHLEKIEEKIIEFQPNTIEMAGIVDYVGDEDMMSILTRLRSYNADSLITCNIVTNIEMLMLHVVVMWRPMHYRSPDNFKKIISDGGFENPEIYVEPWKSHVVARWISDEI